MSICESCNSFYRDAHDWSFTSCREFFWNGEKIGDDTCYEEVIDFLKYKVSGIEVLEGDS